MIIDQLGSLHLLDPKYPIPGIVDLLGRPENDHLLRYVANDPFGAHVFPGNVANFPVANFLKDLNVQLEASGPIHLWAYIPLCPYRCHFCQYPVFPIGRRSDTLVRKSAHWVDLNLREASIWLSAVPKLREVAVGEFNVFGGTPSVLPYREMARLLDFYKARFNFTSTTTIRVEGDPSTLNHGTLEFFAEQGCTKLSCGVESFDDFVLKHTGRKHTAEMALDVIAKARSVGFERVSIDLIYGLLNQTVASVEQDLNVATSADATAVVCAKLHLRSYADTRTAVAGEHPAAWQSKTYRDLLSRRGHRWPSLGEQFQMRSLLATRLVERGYIESPTMYFTRRGKEPEKWKEITLDQNKQEAEVAIGLGGSSSCRTSEVINEVNEKKYVRAIEDGVLPIESARGFDLDAMESRALKMAISTCRPVLDAIHRQRFPGSSLFSKRWSRILGSLESRGFIVSEPAAGVVWLTEEGKTLVEGIINTEL